MGKLVENEWLGYRFEVHPILSEGHHLMPRDNRCRLSREIGID